MKKNMSHEQNNNIATDNTVAKGDPAKLPSRLFYIQGIIRNRLLERDYYYPARGAMPLLADAWRGGVKIDLLESIAKSVDVKTWTNFRDSVYAAWETAAQQSETNPSA